VSRSLFLLVLLTVRFSPEKPDYLSRLPPELLDTILTIASVSAATIKYPLSHTLQPHFERVFYRELHFHSSYQFERFCESATPEKMLLVKSIVMYRSLDINAEDEDDEFDAVGKEEKDWGLVEVAVLARGFRHLEHLEHLGIKGWTRLCLSVLSSSIAASSLPSLKSLELESTLVDIQDPFDPSHYSNLQSYPQLTRLAVSVLRERLSIESSAKRIPSPYFSLVSLRSLHIRGPITSSNHDSSLLRCFSGLEELQLDDETSSASLLGLVNSLPNPSRLETLSVNFLQFPSSTIPPDSPIAFNVFPNIRNLTIIGLVNLETPSFYEDLRNLPLQRIELGYGTKLSIRITKIAGRTSATVRPQHLSSRQPLGFRRLRCQRP